MRVKFFQETSVIVNDAKISVASRESFVKLRAIKASLDAKASNEFHGRHSQEIHDTFQPLALLLTHMEGAAMKLVNSTFDTVLGTFTDYVGSRSEEGTVMFDEAKVAHWGVFPNVKQMYKGLLDEPAQKSLETKYEGLKEIVKDTATAFRLLSGRSTFDVKNESLARTVQGLTATDEANGRVKGMANFTRFSEAILKQAAQVVWSSMSKLVSPALLKDVLKLIKTASEQLQTAEEGSTTKMVDTAHIITGLSTTSPESPDLEAASMYCFRIATAMSSLLQEKVPERYYMDAFASIYTEMDPTLGAICETISIFKFAAQIAVDTTLDQEDGDDEVNSKLSSAQTIFDGREAVTKLRQAAEGDMPSPSRAKLLVVASLQEHHAKKVQEALGNSFDIADTTYKAIKASHDKDPVKHILNAETEVPEVGKQAGLLESAMSEDSNALYDSYKVVTSNPIFHEKFDASSFTMDSVMTSKYEEAIAAHTAFHDATRKAVAINTCVISLFRVLKPKETREDLAKRTSRVLEVKGLKQMLPPSVALMLDRAKLGTSGAGA